MWTTATTGGRPTACYVPADSLTHA